jgi:protein-tyrosine-phosphatase
MAEYFTRYCLQRSGVQTITVESAGVFALDGMRASTQTKELLAGLGIDCSAHRARVFTPEIGRRADLIFVMEQFQGEEVVTRQPEAAGKVYLLKNYNLGPGERIVDPNIADPVGKPAEVYESCFAEIHCAIERVLASLGVKIV